MVSSESIAPSNPNKAPDAPTDTRSPLESVKQDIMLPPSPEITYKAPILTVVSNKSKFRLLKMKKHMGVLNKVSPGHRQVKHWFWGSKKKLEIIYIKTSPQNCLKNFC